MTIIIYLFGAFLILAGISLVAKPALIFNLLIKHADKLWLYLTAIIIRLVLGLILINMAELSRFPLTMLIIGLIAIVAAVFLTLIGWNNFKRLMAWLDTTTKPFARVAGLVSLCFGVFLIYAII